ATRFGGGIEAILAPAEHPAELGTNDSQTLHGGRLRTMLRRAIERAHIDGRGVSFHTLRHSIASRLVAANVDIKTVSTILGPRTAGIVVEGYAEESGSGKRAAIGGHTGAVGHILGTLGWEEQRVWRQTEEKIEEKLVDGRRLELPTSALRTRRSPS